MKRKMIGAAAAYLAGLFFASFFTGLKFAAVFVFLLTLLLIGGIRGKDLLMMFLCFVFAFAAAKSYGRFYHDRIVSYSGSTVDFSGCIVRIENYTGDLSLYTLKGNMNGISGVKINYFGSTLDVEYGDILHLEDCTLSEYTNDYVFRNRDIYMADGIFLNAGNPADIRIERTASEPLKNVLMNYREKMICGFRSSMSGDTGDFLCAMMFGEKGGFDPNMRTSLYRGGIGHVMAVSGLHVSIIAVTLMTLMKRMHIGRLISFLLMNCVMFMFITMAEWPVSAVRAAVMVDFVYSASLFRRQSDTFNSLAGAVLLICIAQPYAVYSSGFLLSAAASFGIGVFGPYMTKNFTERKFARSFVIMICTSLCIFPLTMKFFGETSLVSPVTNLLFLPLCSAALISGAVYVFTGGLIPVLGIAEFLLRPVLWASDVISRNDLSYFSLSGEHSVEIIFALAAAVASVHIIFGKRTLTASAMAVAFSAVMICSAFNAEYNDNFLRIAFLGKGRKTAAVVSYKGSTRIFDLGGYYNAPVYVRKYLSVNGISTVDSVVLTKNEPSQYSVYKSDLAPAKIGEWYADDDIFLYGSDDISSAGEEICFSGGGLEIVCRDGELIIDLNGNIISAGYAGGKKILSVTGDVLDDDIPIDNEEKGGMNNFEITLTGEGRYKFRRL